MDRSRTRRMAAGFVLLGTTAIAGLWVAMPRSRRASRGDLDERADALLAHARAVVEFGKQKDLWQAIGELRSVVAARPDDYEAHLLLAFSLLTVERATEAEPEFLACRGLRPERPEPLVGQASCALGRRDLDDARTLLDRALALAPSFVPALVERGNLRMFLRDDKRALGDFERVVHLDPRNKQGHLKMAQLLRRLGDQAGARRHEQLCREIDREEGLRRIASEPDNLRGTGP